MKYAVAIALAMLSAAALAKASQRTPVVCLHGADESADQKTRRQQALQLTRAINTAEAMQSRSNGGKYPALADLSFSAGVPAGFEARLSTDGNAYAFSVKDTMDPCQFAFFSDQAGVIYNATPIQ